MSIKLLGIIFTKLRYFKHKIFSSHHYKLTKRVIRYLESTDCDLMTEEKSTIQKFLSHKLVSVINYPFVEEYKYRIVNVLKDKRNSLNYVYHNEKKLYFKKGMSKYKIMEMYNYLCIEQDIRSPHSYVSSPVTYSPTDIAVDIGAAEGIWALDIVEKVKELYLFECEDGWIEALEATFLPWKNKVTIVNNYVTDNTNGMFTTLDDYFLPKNIFPSIIKVDIEGEEISAMKGALKLLTNHIRHALLCTYHNVDDFQKLSEMMKNHHFEVKHSEGFIINIYSEPNYNCHNISEIFRKGLIHACKY